MNDIDFLVKEFAERAFAAEGLDYRDYTVIDKLLYRPSEVNILMGDYRKAHHTLGWDPEAHFEGLVEMMVNADMARNREFCAR